MGTLRPFNGMPAQALTAASWRKSRHSNPQGSCVEVAALPGPEIALRNSRHPAGPALIFTVAELSAFVQGAKDGEFDDLIVPREGLGDARLSPTA
ncbi:DUF397 domain-containing protein [Actinocorallia sp. B10E7]|uniref:DUF397 domain-containing protein n=1 Tax=Actinocorallia sp. B10E7 TaxID=3153558 RepID=UPI00325E1E4D